MLWEAEASRCLVALLMPYILRHRKLKGLSVLPKLHSFQTLGDRLISKKWRKTERVKRGPAYSQLGNSETACTFQTGALDTYWFQPMFYA